MNVVRGRELGAPLRLRADVVVVGSGAGGAVVASQLARAGRSVVVLEEGPFVEPSEYGRLTPMHAFRRCAREAGLMAAVGLGESPFISVLAGRCVGGFERAHRRRVLSHPGGDPSRLVHGARPRGYEPGRSRAPLPRRRGAGPRRDGARIDAIARGRALRRRGGEARDPDEAPAAQHARLPGHVAVQLWLPARREAQRRRLVPPRRVRPWRGRRERRARRQGLDHGRGGARGDRVAHRRRPAGARPVRGARRGGRRRVRVPAHAAAARGQRCRIVARRSAPDAAPGGAGERGVRRRRRGLGRGDAARLQQSLRGRGPHARRSPPARERALGGAFPAWERAIARSSTRRRGWACSAA